MRGVRSLRLVLLGVCLLIASAQEETDCSSHIQEMTTLKKLADALKTKTAGLSDKLAECKSVASALRSEKDDVADQLAALNEAHAPVEVRSSRHLPHLLGRRTADGWAGGPSQPATA